MKTKLKTLLVAGLLWAGAPLHLHAQLVADGGTLNLTTATNLSPGSLAVGNTGGNTTLNIIAPGTVTNADGIIGLSSSSSNNTVTVQNSGAVWNNSESLYVGGNGSGNQLVVSQGATVASTRGYLGLSASSSDNVGMVSGVGSLWTNRTSFVIGNSGSGNQLTVSNGATVANFAGGYLGFTASSSNNVAVVTGPGSLWNNSSLLSVGQSGSANRLVVSNGGTVSAADMFVGYLSSSLANRVTVAGGNVIVTNGAGTAVLEILRGTNVLNAGLVEADQLLLTNGALSHFEFNGGTLITRGGTISNGLDFVVGASGATTATLDVRSGNPLVLSRRFILGSNSPNAQLLITNGGTLQGLGVRSVLGLIASSSNNVAVVTGPGSLWTNSNNLHVGDSGSGNQLVISNSATVADTFGTLGRTASSSKNVALVTGTNSLWANLQALFVGDSGSGNQLIVSNGARVASSIGYLGYILESENNVVAVTGPGSLWTNSSELRIGNSGSGNQLIVSDGAVVANTIGLVGSNSSSSNNVAVVTGAGSLWTNSNSLRVGNSGSANQLVVSNGATVQASIAYVGFNTGSSNNVLRLANGTLTAPGGLTVNLHNTLAGSGTINGPATIADGATLSPGASLGKLVLNSSPSLQGNVVMEISKSGATLTNDHVQVNSALTYGGSLTVSNLGPDTLAAGDSFQLFSATSYSGAFAVTNLPALPAGLKWSTPQTNGILAVVTAPGGGPQFGPVTLSGSDLIFSGTGGTTNGDYVVLSSTNVAAPLLNWLPVTSNLFDASGNFLFTNPINPARPQEFYRLRAP